MGVDQKYMLRAGLLVGKAVLGVQTAGRSRQLNYRTRQYGFNLSSDFRTAVWSPDPRLD
jgi:hypothetical protein